MALTARRLRKRSLLPAAARQPLNVTPPHLQQRASEPQTGAERLQKPQQLHIKPQQRVDQNGRDHDASGTAPAPLHGPPIRLQNDQPEREHNCAERRQLVRSVGRDAAHRPLGRHRAQLTRFDRQALFNESDAVQPLAARLHVHAHLYRGRSRQLPRGHAHF